MSSALNAASLRVNAAPQAAPNAASAVVAVATPTATDRPAEHDAGKPRRFAELLQQRRHDRAAPHAAARGAATPDPASAALPATGANAEAPPADDTNPPAPARRAVPRANASLRAEPARNASEPTAVEKPSSPDEPTETEVDHDRAAAAAPTSNAERAADPTALAAVPAAGSPEDRRAIDTHQQQSTRGAQSGDGARAGIARAPMEAQHEAPRARSAVDDDADRRGASRTGDASAVDPRAPVGDAAAQAVAVLGNPPVAFETPAPPAARAVTGLEAVAASSGIGIAQRPSSETHEIAARPAALAFATPIDADDFASALGVQVSLLAQDGVQQAELHLNPADTGPVSIHIAVDGTSARVDFGADLAATRAAIERGLPELASALREAGLTLTGGGVSQHASSRQGGDSAPDGRPQRGWHAGTVGASEPTPRASRRVSVGGVDLYA